jgi:hypothetical protein
VRDRALNRASRAKVRFNERRQSTGPLSKLSAELLEDLRPWVILPREEIQPFDDQLLFALVTDKAMPQLFGVLVHVQGKPSRERNPDHVR